MVSGSVSGFHCPPHKKTDDGADHRDAEVRCQDVPRVQVRAVNLQSGGAGQARE
jgi:hypothetical protein